VGQNEEDFMKSYILRNKSFAWRSKLIAGSCLAILMAAAGQGQDTAALKRSFHPASVRALPGLECQLYPEGSVPSKGVTVFTDDDGYARFHAVRAAASDKIQRLALSCKDSEGGSSAFSADLTSEDTFRPRPLNLAGERGTDRPALAGDPLSYGQSELIQAGYGLRPDPETEPAAYSRWLAAARVPGRMLDAKRPSPHSHTVTTETGGPWVGSVLAGAPYYISIEGGFNVPTAVPGGDETGGGTEISIWDGLGGFGTGSGLIQAGVNLLTVGSLAAVYGSWREFCCGPGGDSNGYGGAFTPNPGDKIYDQNWYCDADGSLNIKGGYGCSYLEDLTTGAVLSCTSPSGSPCWSAKVHSGMTLGVDAEFIIENQSGQCCSPAVQFTDFTPEVIMTGSAYTSTTKSYSQTISSDSHVYLLTDFTNSTSHMNVALGTTDQTYFAMTQFEKTSGLTPASNKVKCASTSGYCYGEYLAVGPNAEGSSIGDGWALGTTTTAAGDDYLLYRWINGAWVHQSGIAGLQIAVSPTGNPWVVNHLGQIYYNNGSTWVLAPGGGCATWIAVGPNAYGSTYGDPWVIGCGGGYGKNGGVWQLQGSTWVKQPGSATQIAVGNFGYPWIIDAAGTISSWNGSGFTAYGSGCATNIAVGPYAAGIDFGEGFGDVWVTGCTAESTGYPIFQLQFGDWVKVPGYATQIALSPDLGVPWTTNNLGQVYR
jgi:hypothetical protein